jgi:hypothetical protein
MKEKFKDVNFRAASLALVETCNEIIDDYQGQDLRLTLRQLYYQLVSRNVIPNVERSYKNLSALLNDARLAGLVDWEAIEDRVRTPRRASQWDSISDLVDAAVASFRLPRWAGQDYYAELWVEKDALAGVLEPLAREFHVTLMVNRGYSSASAMYESAQRFIANDGGRECALFYLGDFDPSGEDMVRDVRDRLRLFGADVKVTKIALTTDQIETYNPPPNPAKRSDPRAAEFIAKNGATSYEVDALPPNVLAEVVREAFADILDREKMDEVIAREEIGKAKLIKAAKRIEV